ncbi:MULTISPECIES: hypothetical protein [Paenibacillus]|uniref:Uncharacterized protein n=1 Tax=Paenibacillus lautus TaxID=1401 RepID=A0A1R1AYG8_PAELA|nr:hypothetical protein [Paenibacillus lautus]OME90815.1 hypothetical protein BK123_20925 [Paenibacillus lautus]
MRIRRTTGEVIFDTANFILLSLFCIAVAIPLIHVIAGSLSSNAAITHSEVKLWPVGFMKSPIGLVTKTVFTFQESSKSIMELIRWNIRTNSTEVIHKSGLSLIRKGSIHAVQLDQS